jgi:hypothetical protein
MGVAIQSSRHILSNVSSPAHIGTHVPLQEADIMPAGYVRFAYPSMKPRVCW